MNRYLPYGNYDGDKAPIDLWAERNDICELCMIRDEVSGAQRVAGMQEGTLLTFGGVPVDPLETLVARLDAALVEAKRGTVEGKA